MPDAPGPKQDKILGRLLGTDRKPKSTKYSEKNS